MTAGGNQVPDQMILLLCNSPMQARKSRFAGLRGAMESTLPEIFSPEYKDLIAAEKQRLSRELYGTEGG